MAAASEVLEFIQKCYWYASPSRQQPKKYYVSWGWQDIHQSRPPNRRMYTPGPLSVVPGISQLCFTFTVITYLAASLRACPLRARARAALQRPSSILACGRNRQRIGMLLRV